MAAEGKTLETHREQAVNRKKGKYQRRMRFVEEQSGEGSGGVNGYVSNPRSRLVFCYTANFTGAYPSPIHQLGGYH